MDDLVKRLRDYSDGALSYEVMAEAADRITEQAAEIERLRAGLQAIANVGVHSTGYLECPGMAEQALSDGPLPAPATTERD